MVAHEWLSSVYAVYGKKERIETIQSPAVMLTSNIVALGGFKIEILVL